MYYFLGVRQRLLMINIKVFKTKYSKSKRKKMKKKILVLLILNILFLSSLRAQSLNKERVNKLKRSIVKVFVEGGISSGTGFFISENGDVLTCWHVIQAAIKTDSLGNILDIKRIYIEFINRDTIEMAIPIAFFRQKKNTEAVLYDFCVLKPDKKLTGKTEYFQIGKFEDIEEGDEIYTAGYPLGIPDQFISKGLLSNKYIDSSIMLGSNKVRRNLALLDLTINRGNSGGPIIKLGKSVNDDRIIGIVDFLVTKNGSTAESLIKELDKRKIDIKINDGKGNLVNLIGIFKMFAEAIAYSSNGISGCVSINHFLQSSK